MAKSAIEAVITPDKYVISSCGYDGATQEIPDWLQEVINNSVNTQLTTILEDADDARNWLEDLEKGVNQTIIQVEESNLSLNALVTTVASELKGNIAGYQETITTMVNDKASVAAVDTKIGAIFTTDNSDATAFFQNNVKTYADAISANAVSVTNLVASYNDIEVRVVEQEFAWIGLFTDYNGVGNPELGERREYPVGSGQYQIWLGDYRGWVNVDAGILSNATAWAGGASSFVTNNQTGAITGWGYNDSSITNSEFIISADTFKVVNPGGDGTGINFDEPVFQVDTTNSSIQLNGHVSIGNSNLKEVPLHYGNLGYFPFHRLNGDPIVIGDSLTYTGYGAPYKLYVYTGYGLTNGWEDQSGQGVVKSFAFFRAAYKPDPPEGGVYTDPKPTTAGWEDGVPAENDTGNPVWMSTRIFTSDKRDPYQDDWTEPELVGDTANTNYQWSTNVAYPGSPNTSGGPSNIWTDNYIDAIWMAVSTSKRDGLWYDWNVVKVKGERGTNLFTKTVFKVDVVGATNLDKPSGGYFSNNAFSPPPNWLEDKPAVPDTVNGTVYTVYESTSEWEYDAVAGTYIKIKDWSDPVDVGGHVPKHGIDYFDGDSLFVEFIFSTSSSTPNIFVSGSSTKPAISYTSTWKDDPEDLGVDSSTTQIYVSKGTCIKVNGVWKLDGSWSTPSEWNGVKGERGAINTTVDYHINTDLAANLVISSITGGGTVKHGDTIWNTSETYGTVYSVFNENTGWDHDVTLNIHGSVIVDESINAKAIKAGGFLVASSSGGVSNLPSILTLHNDTSAGGELASITLSTKNYNAYQEILWKFDSNPGSAGTKKVYTGISAGLVNSSTVAMVVGAGVNADDSHVTEGMKVVITGSNTSSVKATAVFNDHVDFSGAVVTGLPVGSSGIEEIVTGTGLIGGGSSSTVDIDIDFGTGSSEVARGNHTHTSFTGNLDVAGYVSAGPNASPNATYPFITDRKMYATYGFKAGISGELYDFTGAHEVYVPTACITFDFGDILSLDKIELLASVSGSFMVVKGSTTSKDKKVLGVYSKYIGITDEILPKEPDMTEEILNVLLYRGFSTLGVNSLGEGGINVCEEGGDIENGDYICSSNTPGKGMKQDDDLLHNYTVAKSLQDVVWDDEVVGETCEEINGVKWKMIACTYHCG